MSQETETAARTRTGNASRTQAIVMVGLTVALVTVCTWVTIPLGIIPFTLQMFAIPFAICALSPSRSIAAIYAYVALGAVGVPVFSGMRGGIAALAGPTGGFLLGYLIGVPLAALFLWAVRKAQGRTTTKGMPHNGIISGTIAGLIFTACAYVVGCIQYVAITGVTPYVAIATCVLPFIVVDIIKIVVAAICANRVTAALAK